MIRVAIGAIALFLANVYLCRELFRTEWLRHMGSIEGAYIGISRYILDHWGDLSWFPLWYAGVPYQNTYPPLLHLLVALAAKILGYSAAHAHHWVTAWMYCLGPVALFALALRLSKSFWTALAAATIYSFVSTSAWLIPAIAHDLGSRLYPRRLQTLVFYGEGPHVTALALLPLAVLFVDLALQRRKPQWFALAAVAVAAPVLTNWLAAFALALMMLCYVLARLDAKGWNLRDLLYLASIGVAAYLLALPFAPPSTLAVTQHNAQLIGGDYRQVYEALPRWIAVILAALVWIKIAMRRAPIHLQFAVLFAFLTSLVTLSASWFHVSIMPQPERYHLEMEVALALVVAFAGHAMLKNRRRETIVVLAILGVALVLPIRKSRRYARDLIRSIDITTTTEWRTAQWLKQNLPHERALLAGSNSFWLTAFSDVPELTGGFEQGMTDFEIREGVYQVYTGAGAGSREAEYSLLWLKALGVQAINMTGPASGEFYHPYANPTKFDGILEPLWREGDDAILRVQQAPLARLIPRSALVSRAPLNGIDVDPLRPYVAALDNPASARASFDWTSGHSVHIKTDLQKDEVVSIQIAWHGGWHAVLNGSPAPVHRDAIGFMYIDPPTAGPAEIDLIYDGGSEMKIARWLSILTALVLVAASTHAILKKSW